MIDEQSEPEERPLTHEELSTPEMQEAIDKARSRVGVSHDERGKTADDLLKLAREQRRVETTA
jgi:hypothetical protein